MPQTVCLTFIDPFPPFCTHTAGGPEGVCIGIVVKAFDWLGVDCRLNPASLVNAMAMVKRGDSDGLVAAGVTPERRIGLAFSQIYVDTGASLFFSASAMADKPRSAERTVIVTPATGPIRGYAASSFPGASVEFVDDYAAGLAAVTSGRADAAALNIHVGSLLAESFTPGRLACSPVFAHVPLALATGPGPNEWMISAFNQALTSMKRDGSLDEALARLEAGRVPQLTWSECSGLLRLHYEKRE